MAITPNEIKTNSEQADCGQADGGHSSTNRNASASSVAVLERGSVSSDVRETGRILRSLVTCGSELLSTAATRRAAIVRPHWEHALSLIERLPSGAELLARGLGSLLDQPEVTGGSSDLLAAEERALLERCIESLFPWRKGPFELAGIPIDAEWRSDRKFARLEPFIPSLACKRVLDIGCNNGYYLFRLAGLARRRGEDPELLFGIDPSERFLLQFDLVQRFLQIPRCEYEPLGIEYTGELASQFDLTLCLGIIYHQRDPLAVLTQVLESLRPGGTAMIESQTIPGEEDVALVPQGRYAKARNVYWVPTPGCLAETMRRAGFHGVEIVSETEVTEEEQRRTALAPYESLGDFLDPHDRSKTVEGYPAPRRTIVVGRRNF